MTTIKILPEILSNQIAAGEVVERPVSIVKELVENSIDAQARNITIEIISGGKSLIRISDDGIGLSRDDALLAIERYATSKIYTKEDLFCISTMGFRGEALPSIASVCKFTLVTRTMENDIATRIDMAGGKIVNVSDTGAPVGTMVEVKSLFFNTPARKKFLKSDATESSHVTDAVFGMALGHPAIRFRLFVNQRLQRHFSLTDDLFQRTVQVLGKDTAGQLYPIDFSEPDLKIYGYCANPALTRSTSSKIFLFVNHRLIYDRGLISAIFKGCRGRIMKGRFPLGAFFIDIAHDQVDINVHPAKREIRFFNGQRVYGAMATAIEQTLAQAQQNVTTYSKASVNTDAVEEKIADTFESGKEKTDTFPFEKPVQTAIDWPQKNPKPADRFEKRPDISINTAQQDRRMSLPELPVCLKTREAAEHQEESKNPEHGGKSCAITAESEQSSCEMADSPDHTDHAGKVREIKVIGQIMGTYILVESGDGLLMIDQHAAHERIVYERFKHRYEQLDVQTQTLAVPQTLDLNFKEADCFNHLLPDLDRFGFLIEPFGGTTYVVKGVPAMIDDQDITTLLLEIIDSAMGKKDQSPASQWLDDCLILMACHTAIRAKKTLNMLQMRTLVEGLECCENSRHCPHGRPIQLFWSRHQIEKLFKRKV